MSQFVTTSDENSWFIIANPTSGKGNFSKNWKLIEQFLNAKYIKYSYAFTQFSKHEIELVENAIQNGFRNFITVGGDGTLHHVVNGIMMQRYVKSSDITIGVIPLGTGNDWIKTYNIPLNIKKSIEIILQNKTVLQDIGVLQTKNTPLTYFNNVAGLGYDGYIVHKLNTLKKFGAISYLLAGIYGLFFYKKSIFTIYCNDILLREKCLMTVIGLCKFSGGGMQFTKNVNPSDGYFDISIVKNFSFLEVLFNLPKLYSGKIVHHKKVATYKTKEISIVPKNLTSFIQADGELIGTGKITAKIITKAIRFVVK
ncbi:diacylglycerol/lipid kinase family protein [Polaribacter sp. R77954]|uniref:diacylglycerol/lipid kinase family protein n=1 Tax=Polaribacter sp. R77954 TaxID=3093870 RepID=UPI0037C77981